MFPTEFTQKSAGKSAGKAKSPSNGWACDKGSWSWAWASAQASWGVAPALFGTEGVSISKVIWTLNALQQNIEEWKINVNNTNDHLNITIKKRWHYRSIKQNHFWHELRAIDSLINIVCIIMLKVRIELENRYWSFFSFREDIEPLIYFIFDKYWTSFCFF